MRFIGFPLLGVLGLSRGDFAHRPLVHDDAKASPSGPNAFMTLGSETRRFARLNSHQSLQTLLQHKLPTENSW
jgi:hypothetical protein